MAIPARQLVHWATLHAADTYPFRGTEITGADLAVTIRTDLGRTVRVFASVAP